MPLYTALGLFVNSYLPAAVNWVFDVVHFFGAPLIWVNIAVHQSPISFNPHLAILASSSLLGVLFGWLFNGYVGLGTYSILVHSWRLTILAWLATAVIAAAVIGYMVAAGIS